MRVYPFLFWFISCVGVYVLVVPSVALGFAGGSGEPNDPYQIATREDLLSIGSDPNLLDKHYVLASDINLDPCLPGGKVFTETVIAPRTWPEWHKFSGTFNGQNHKIRRMTFASLNSETQHYLALFGGIASGAMVSNLHIEDVNVNAGNSICAGLTLINSGKIAGCSISGSLKGGYGFGGLVGENDGEIDDCVSMCIIEGRSGVGGIVGNNQGRITLCTSSGMVSGRDDIAGLVGSNSGAIQNCQSYSVVSSQERAGGLVSTNNLSGIIENCRNSGSVNGIDSGVGGLVGLNAPNAKVKNCHNSGVVCGAWSVGGGVGWNTGTVEACSNTGNVCATNDMCGGFVGISNGLIRQCFSRSGVTGRDYVGGFMGRGGSVSNCYSTGTVKGHAFVGGFVGQGDDISNCYSTCTVHLNDVGGQDPIESVGGFAGDASEEVSCLWDIETSALPDSAGGVGLTTQDMQDIQTYLDAGWDFVGESDNGYEDIWVMPTQQASYPRLVWEEVRFN